MTVSFQITHDTPPVTSKYANFRTIQTGVTWIFYEPLSLIFVPTFFVVADVLQALY